MEGKKRKASSSPKAAAKKAKLTPMARRQTRVQAATGQALADQTREIEAQSRVLPVTEMLEEVLHALPIFDLIRGKRANKTGMIA